MIIKNCTIFTLGDNKIENGFISLKNKKVADFGKMENLKHNENEDKVFDARGMLAFPGLIDAHTHLGLFGDGIGVEGDDGNESTDPITPQLRAIDGINPFDRSFSEALDWGVTTVVTGPGSSNPISGQLCALKTFGICVDEMAINSALAMKMALGENPKETYQHRSQFPTTRMATAALIRDTLSRTKRYMEDLQKSRDDENEYEKPEYDAKLEALLPVLQGRMKVHIHAHRADDILTAIRLANEFSFDVVIIHATEAHLISSVLKNTNMKIICGPILGSRNKPELILATRKLPAILSEQGIIAAICTDHPELPQDCLMLSAAIAHQEGLSRDAALRAVTFTAAKICGLEHRVGSIDIGKDADIVLYDKDPLMGLIRPTAVFCEGIQVR